MVLSFTILSSGLPHAEDTSKAVTIVTDHFHFLPQSILWNISNQKALVPLLKIPLHVFIPSSTPIRFLEFFINSEIQIQYSHARSHLASDTEAVISLSLRLSVLPEFLCAHKAVPEEVLGVPLPVPQYPGPDPLTGLDTL